MSSRPESPSASENTPLLSRQDEESQTTYNDQQNGAATPRSQSISSLDSKTKKQKRWPTIIALTALCIGTVIAIIGFTVPSIAQEYAKQALVFEPQSVSIDSFTSLGVRTRIQGDFVLDPSRVKKKSLRDLGKAATWIAAAVRSGESEVEIYLPEYDNVLLGTAWMPPIEVNIRPNHHNKLDVLANLEPGDVDGIRRVAKDFLDGRLKGISARAIAKVPLRSGLINIGMQTVEQMLHFRGDKVPQKPEYNITNLRFAEYGPPGHPNGVRAKTTVSAMNDYPISFDVPPLNFEILLPDCEADYSRLATASTEMIRILPKQKVKASVTGLVEQLPTALTRACPQTGSSPLDRLVADYLAGQNATVYVRGADQESDDTPDWVGKILKDTMLPFTLPGHPFDSLIKNFSLADTHFSLPDPFAEDSRPTISAVVKVLVGLPKEMNVNLDVDRVRADALVFYKGRKMGKLDLHKWQAANATKIEDDLLVQSVIENAPLEIIDNDVFTEVVQQLVFGSKGVQLAVEAKVDVNTATALGEFVVRQIPARGAIFVKPISRDGFFGPKISDIKVVDSSRDSLTLQANANISNPTEYSAHVPYVNVSIIINETLVGYAWSSAEVKPGFNDIQVRASWDTSAVGAEWISRFLSGYNTSLTVRSHENSIPGLPDIGLNLTIPTPHADEMFGKFIREATVRSPI
jgi:hypothetical protein